MPAQGTWSLLYVVAALTVVGALGQEGSVIRMPAIPMLFYLVAAGALTLAIATFS